MHVGLFHHARYASGDLQFLLGRYICWTTIPRLFASLGDATMITVRAGGSLVSVKAAKDFRAEIGDQVSIAIDPAICHLFHHETGVRLDAV